MAADENKRRGRCTPRMCCPGCRLFSFAWEHDWRCTPRRGKRNLAQGRMNRAGGEVNGTLGTRTTHVNAPCRGKWKHWRSRSEIIAKGCTCPCRARILRRSLAPLGRTRPVMLSLLSMLSWLSFVFSTQRTQTYWLSEDGG